VDGDDLVGVLLRGDLPEPVIVGEVTAFLLAALDEPPGGLAAVWYLLGRSPQVAQRLHEELDRVLGAEPYSPAADPELPYLDAVIAEALRLYPPARYVDRCPVSDTAIAGTPVRRGTNILISPLVTHHERSLYDRPAEFLPERWLSRKTQASPHRGTYLPFGAGSHACIGEPLARLIMATTLATVARRWRFRIDDRSAPPVPGQPDLEIVVEPR
jgi:cytochrome P450